MNLYFLLFVFAAPMAAGQETQNENNASEVIIQKKDGSVIAQRVMGEIAGKITLLPGNITLVEGQQLRLTTVTVGADWVKFYAGLSPLFIGESAKSKTKGGATVREYTDGIIPPPGDWKITVIAGNLKGNFSDVITVRVLPIERIQDCCAGWGNK